MAIINKPIPTLRGKEAERFMRKMKEAEKEHGTIDYSLQHKEFEAMMNRSKIFKQVSSEELKKRRIDVYPYLM